MESRFFQKMHGFTLLEILVAMAILSVTVTAMMMSFRGGTTSWNSGDARSQRNQSARAALEMMTRDLINIFTKAATLYQIEGYNGTWNDSGTTRDADEIYFTAASNIPDTTAPKKYDLCEVGYKIIDTARALYRVEDTSIDADLMDGTDSLLAPHVIGLNFEYRTAGSWQNSYTKSTTRPDAVKVNVQVEDEFQRETPKNFKTIIKLP